tara:strand:- start:320 stop:538 length:219 start_codon:yes stop_codon:yes gene_type:complete
MDGVAPDAAGSSTGSGSKSAIQLDQASREDLIVFLRKQATLIKKLQAKAAAGGGGKQFIYFYFFLELTNLIS